MSDSGLERRKKHRTVYLSAPLRKDLPRCLGRYVEQVPGKEPLRGSWWVLLQSKGKESQNENYHEGDQTSSDHRETNHLCSGSSTEPGGRAQEQDITAHTYSGSQRKFGT